MPWTELFSLLELTLAGRMIRQGRLQVTWNPVHATRELHPEVPTGVAKAFGIQLSVGEHNVLVIVRWKVHQIYDGLPLVEVSANGGGWLRASLGIPERAPVVTVVARMRWEKGYDTLLRAFPLVLQAVPDARLLIVGSGPEEVAVRSAAKELGAAVHLIGHREDVMECYRAASVVVQPSIADAFPLTVVEAMSAGRAVVGSDVHGISEAIEHGVTGLLVPSGDELALATALTRLLQDRALSAMMGRAAFDRYRERFTAERMISSWVECYASLVR